MMYSRSSSSSRGRPDAAISSPSAFILSKYSITVEVPLRVVAKAIRVFTDHDQVCDAYMPWIIAHASAAVLQEET
jgi:hypothetical protein